MTDKIPPDQYYAQLAKVPTSGGAIIRNTREEFLIVSHPYKEGWHIPGGMTEKDESPRQAVIREIREELGINIQRTRPFCIDFAKDGSFTRILFVFDCGIISDKTISDIAFDKNEISGFRFVTEGEMVSLLAPRIRERIKNSISYLHANNCVYLEDGKDIEKETEINDILEASRQIRSVVE